jgi:hypothetical protein
MSADPIAPKGRTTMSDAAEQLEARLVALEAERDEASAFAETQIAGMREVALMRAANAQALIGTLARPLLAELKRAIEVQDNDE